MQDDLLPSGKDKRPVVQQGTIGPFVGQVAPDFTVTDTRGNPITLSVVAPQYQASVFYFTMWCPTCDSHMSHLLANIAPQFPSARYFAVDYVSGTVTEAWNAEVSNGYAGTAFTVLADTSHAILNAFQGTMGTTVVVDAGGVIRMNEDYKDGSRLLAILGGLP